MNFDEFRRLLFQQQAEGNYTDGVALIETHSAEFPTEKQRISYWHACLLTQLGQTESALDVLEAALEENHWFGPSALLKDGLLAPLRESARFDQILAESEVQLMKALENSYPSRIVFEPTPLPDEPLPVLFALHGNGSSAKAQAEEWDMLAESGWLVVLPQSSQLDGPDFYQWNDAALAHEEVCQHFREISAEYSIDPSRIVLGGYSRGGLRALEMTLNSDIPATGYIGICPSVHYIEDAVALATAASGTPRLHITIGDRDKNHPHAESLVETLRTHGQSCALVSFEGGHQYPSDMPSVLNQAIAFVTTQS